MAPPAEGECEGGDCDACEEMTAAEILTGKVRRRRCPPRRFHPSPPPSSPLPPHPIRASRPATRHRDQGTYFPGLLPLTYAYLEAIDCDPETKEAMRVYLDFIRRRATGELQTGAEWMRTFVKAHPGEKLSG